MVLRLILAASAKWFWSHWFSSRTCCNTRTDNGVASSAICHSLWNSYGSVKFYLAWLSTRCKLPAIVGEILTIPTTAMDGNKLSKAREVRLSEMIRESQIFSRRAKTPEDRIALAEIEHALLEIKKRWSEAGLINGQVELPLAAESLPPGGRR